MREFRGAPNSKVIPLPAAWSAESHLIYDFVRSKMFVETVSMKRCAISEIIVAAALIAPWAVRGQTFEVASVKPAGADCRGKSSIDRQQVRYANFSLMGLVRDAYRVETSQIEAPAWFEARCYDVAAKLPEGAAAEQIPTMLRALLAERFRMKVHLESRPERIYELVVAKGGARLNKAKAPNDRPNAVEIRGDRLEFTSATLKSFCGAMSTLLSRPVVDRTEIQGYFDIVLRVAREDLAGIRLPQDQAIAETTDAGNASPSLFAAMRELGLNLTALRAAVEHIVVVSADPVPVGN
jgi:uncharacterized protein (TIGR03435 family)